VELKFEWDENKSLINDQKHGISFTEAKTVFNDPLSLTIYDPKHSINENRFIEIGRSSQGRLIIVVYTERLDKIRIISSRKATNNERKQYEQY
jgi:hypothetical protein